ncbi:MAG: prepilin-type N-terminal cleavage/methylation domain-containing protein [Candidatus Eremiobacteraeota bacterium]|nr:prepilin-type N-terminal cleavage/methylation domain-containing protein [Candidatus Eremiobacteraeota bacterium]
MRRRGISLAELMVAIAILAFLLTGLYLILVAGAGYFRKGSVAATVHQQARLGLRKLTVEIENSQTQSIYAADAPVPYLIMPSADAPRPAQAGQWTLTAGRLTWQKWVCFWLDNDQLVRAELVVPPLPAEDLPVPADPDYPAFGDFSAAPREVLARHIYDLDFTVDSALGGGPTVALRVVARQATASDKATEVVLQNRVYPRNTR